MPAVWARRGRWPHGPWVAAWAVGGLVWRARAAQARSCAGRVGRERRATVAMTAAVTVTAVVAAAARVVAAREVAGRAVVVQVAAVMVEAVVVRAAAVVEAHPEYDGE